MVISDHFTILKYKKQDLTMILTVAAVSSLLEFSFTEHFALLTHFAHLTICIIFRMIFLQKPILISFAQVSVIYFTESLSVKFKCYYSMFNISFAVSCIECIPEKSLMKLRKFSSGLFIWYKFAKKITVLAANILFWLVANVERMRKL